MGQFNHSISPFKRAKRFERIFEFQKRVGRRVVWTTRRRDERVSGRRNKEMKEWRKEIMRTFTRTFNSCLPFALYPERKQCQGVCTSDVCSALCNTQHTSGPKFALSLTEDYLAGTKLSFMLFLTS